MTRFIQALWRLPWMEMVGVLVCGFGLCFAIGFVGHGLDKERAKEEKTRIQQSLDDMRGKLTAAKVPEDQIAGLLRIHRSALVTEAAHQSIGITSVLFLLSLVVALFGFVLVLWSKMRVLVAANKALHATAAAPDS